jgi:hypothetical protein
MGITAFFNSREGPEILMMEINIPTSLHSSSGLII